MVMTVPGIYEAGYRKARASPSIRLLADKYVEHALVGDPPADAAVAALDGFDRMEAHRLMAAGMDRDDDVLRTGPRALRDFFAAVGEPPAWVDREAMAPGWGGFHDNVYEFVLGVVAGSIVQGFTTSISRAFAATGRTVQNGSQRYRQNLRHILEIMLPGGLDRTGEGWKLSVRIRFVHARVRRLLLRSGEWNVGEDGQPLSAAQVATACTLFSARHLDYAEALGARLTPEQRDGFMAVWRYTSWLLGVPETLLFRDKAEADELCRVAFLCEPPPGVDSVLMAHNIVNAAWVLFGIADPVERKAAADNVYRVSRSLIGDETADFLKFPRPAVPVPLAVLRLKRRLHDAAGRVFPGVTKRRRAQALTALLDVTRVDDHGLGMSYLLPTAAHEDRSAAW